MSGTILGNIQCNAELYSITPERRFDSALPAKLSSSVIDCMKNVQPHIVTTVKSHDTFGLYNTTTEHNPSTPAGGGASYIKIKRGQRVVSIHTCNHAVLQL